jgi:putative copper export protein
VTRREGAAAAGTVVTSFSRYAARLVPLILLAGIAMAALLLDSWSGLTTPYGLSLLGKSAAFAVLMALAAANRWRFGPGIVDGSPAAVKGFQFTTRAEWCLILAVLMLTAVMTSLFAAHP